MEPLLVRAARREPVDVTPVWFMRQAGRSLPEYRALRERHSFMSLVTTPELAARATLLPVDRLGVDAAVLFADIMLPLACLGVPFEIRPGLGPVGADTVQLFDSWLGLLDPLSYEAMVLPYTRRIFAAVSSLAPTIHFSTGTVALLELIAASGCLGVSVDWRLPLDVAWQRLGPEIAIQGNLDRSE